jgi:hypothetical protein
VKLKLWKRPCNPEVIPLCTSWKVIEVSVGIETMMVLSDGDFSTRRLVQLKAPVSKIVYSCGDKFKPADSAA